MISGAARRRTSRRRIIALFIAPFALGSLLLVLLPALMTFVLSFLEFDAMSAPRPAGLENFFEVAGDRLFWVAIGNSLFLILLSIPLRVAGALMLALLLRRRFLGSGAFRAAVYVPTVIPEAAFALAALWIFNPVFGPINSLLAMAGLPAPAWLADARTAKLVFVAMSMFTIGEGFVMMLAARRAIPASYYEAASLEGCGSWETFRAITLPLLSPWLMLLAARDIVVSMHSSFTQAYLMTGGDPYYATLFVPFLAYEEAFDRFRFGPGSAIMLLMFVASLAMIAALYVAFRRWGYFDVE